MFKKVVKELLDNGLKERDDLFLIDFDILEDNTIMVVIDGDNGVLVEDCMFISRAIEHNLDREEQDFSLEITSAGATAPLKNNRQFKKNVGRIVDLKAVNNQAFEAKLAKADDEGVTLEWKAREPKPIGKGKVTVQKQVTLSYSDILEAKVKIKF
jgi:ribosome maturation factor RimP